MNDKYVTHGLYRLRIQSIEEVNEMIADINTVFYEEVERNE